MEKMTIHAGGLQRRLPAPLPTLVVACVEKNETQRARHAFKTYNFSCILRGRGAYRWRGQSYEVEAPVVFQQWPDEPIGEAMVDVFDVGVQIDDDIPHGNIQRFPQILAFSPVVTEMWEDVRRRIDICTKLPGNVTSMV